jgi:hypothetical protein
MTNLDLWRFNDTASLKYSHLAALVPTAARTGASRTTSPYYYYVLCVFHGATAPSGPGPPHYRGFTITLRHITLGRTPLDEGSARRTHL